MAKLNCTAGNFSGLEFMYETSLNIRRNSSNTGPFRSRPIRAQQIFSRPIRIAHFTHVTYVTSQCPYLGMVLHVTPWNKEHTHTRVESALFAQFYREKSLVVGRMRRWGPSVCPAQSREQDRRHMRRPPIVSPGPPHACEPISTQTYCACANYEKQSQTPRIPKVKKKHTLWRSTSTFLIDTSRGEPR